MDAHLTIEECKPEMKVKDTWFGEAVIVEVLKTRIKVKFQHRADLVTYTSSNIKICLERIN